VAKGLEVVIITSMPVEAIRSGQVGRADMIGGAPVDTEDLMKVVVLEVVEH